MRNKSRKSEAGFGVWGALLLLILIGLIVAAVMKVLAIWAAIVIFVAAVIVIGLLANISDITRYMKISSM
jgi:hypothetical protein